ncbi:FAD dependent oxidoreductase TIGR03364 [Paracoccus halophilus]|uniref:FAD dependent oxidoreductase TIGR03364 n=1 Tax=Paracoccus halophilus TaxID=376733 RepID=A0A099F5Z4_9RHOB|nr:TIGR03364 family FAD-dependent oxidoreductase [Paracoccus halophilus]KGJ05651.1 FAD-dependent oxidoreductase [Paracoccus halophilus]SFA47689.1 FAD dependent oxidoreductase TIGR03364 [Paracoccus halophilus]
MKQYDLAVVGAGILGLAHALIARRAGKSVVVLDRDNQANGASIRNFGFVTVTGQQSGAIWRHARRSRDIWAEVAPAAGIEALHQGLVVTAQRPEAEAVLDAFLQTEMGEGCRRLTAGEAGAISPALRAGNIRSALYSPHEIRVESRSAIPALAAWLRAEGVDFLWNTTVQNVQTPKVETSSGVIEAAKVVVCPGDDFTTLFSDRIAARDVTRCKLHMLRLTPETPLQLGAAVMSDLSLVRYLGYAELPEAQALKQVIEAEQPEYLSNGVHLIAVQSADGSLVVGDSHHYAATPDPFQPAAVDTLIAAEFDRVIATGGFSITDRWIGTYASSDAQTYFADAPDDDTRLVIVTAGCGASTAFSIAEETLATLF